MAVDVELTEGNQPNEYATDAELEAGKKWIENEFWNQLPGRKERPGNKITWDYKSDLMQHSMQVELDGKQGTCKISDNDVRDCLENRAVQKRVRRLLKQLASPIIGGIR